MIDQEKRTVKSRETGIMKDTERGIMRSKETEMKRGKEDTGKRKQKGKDTRRVNKNTPDKRGRRNLGTTGIMMGGFRTPRQSITRTHKPQESKGNKRSPLKQKR